MRKGILGYLILLLNACWCARSSTHAPQQKRDVVVPTAFGHADVTITIRPWDEQRVTIGPYCGAAVVEASDWKTALEKLYIVEVGATIQTLYGPAYGIRFRNRDVYGDVAARTLDSLCQSVILRIQWAPDNAPVQWTEAFGLADLIQALALKNSDTRYFSTNPKFPSTYP